MKTVMMYSQVRLIGLTAGQIEALKTLVNGEIENLEADLANAEDSEAAAVAGSMLQDFENIF